MHITIDKSTTESVVFIEPDEAILDVEADAVINASCPIQVIQPEELIINLNGHTLSVIATEQKQPCIGAPTHTDMSYGRWCVEAQSHLKKIIVNNGVLALSSNTPYFTIGTYNEDSMPEVILNNATAQYQEKGKKRKLVNKRFPPSGSTKISGEAEYVLYNEGEEVPFSSKQLEALEQLKQEHVDTTDFTVAITSEDILTLGKFRKLGVDISPAMEQYKLVRENLTTYLEAIMCGVVPNDPGLIAGITSMRIYGIIAEAGIQELEIKAILKNCLNMVVDELPEDAVEILRNYVTSKYNSALEMSPTDLEIWWTLIDVFTYRRQGTHADDVQWYWFKSELPKEPEPTQKFCCMHKQDDVSESTEERVERICKECECTLPVSKVLGLLPTLLPADDKDLEDMIRKIAGGM